MDEQRTVEGKMDRLVVELSARAEATHDDRGRVAARELIQREIDYDDVIRIARYGNELARRKALALVFYLAKHDFVSVLARSLHEDESDIVRHEAAYYLGMSKCVSAVGALTFALKRDPSHLVRHEAAEALGDMAAIEALDALRSSLADPEAVVARTAALAIDQLMLPNQHKGTEAEACAYKTVEV